MQKEASPVQLLANKPFKMQSSIADQIGYSENTEKVVSAAQSLSEGTRDTKG
jgi:hypothetical protein